MYIADHQTDKIHQFTLSVGYNLASTVVNSGTLDVSSQNDSPYGVEFSQDGSKVFVVGNGTQGDAVYQYTLNTAWDITSTATYNDSFNLSSQDSVPADIRFNNDGTKMFIAGSNGNEIDEYTLSTPFEIASISGDHDGDVLVDDPLLYSKSPALSKVVILTFDKLPLVSSSAKLKSLAAKTFVILDGVLSPAVDA